MKRSRYFFLSALFIAVFASSSCIKDDHVTLQESFVEWDAAVHNANAGGRTYPVITRQVLGGQPQNNADPVINSNIGVVKLRVNLVGPHRSTPTEFTFSAVDGEPALANHVYAVAGTHYNTSGKVTIPANSSFGEAEITINKASSAGQAALLVLELQGAGDVKLMENKKKIGISIAQVAP